MPRSLAALIAMVALASLTGTALATADEGGSPDVSAAGRNQATQLISRNMDGGTPNGASTKAVISGDRRYVRVVAFESEASDLVRGDTNNLRDVFAIKRAGTVDNTGRPFSGGAPILLSRGEDGQPANGPSHSLAVSGDFRHAATCIVFLSAASNLVDDDTNGKQDAFAVKEAGFSPSRISLPDNKQATEDTTAVAVAGDCKQTAFVTGGKLYVREGATTKLIKTKGAASDPSFAQGDSNDLVFTARGGVYLSANGTGKPKLVGRGGRNPVFNNLKRRTLAYERTYKRKTQIYYGDVGKRARIISKRGKKVGNKASRNPVIGNSGFYVTFETDATNLTISAAGSAGDNNKRPDSYLFSDSRDTTLLQSVRDKGEPMPGGGQNPSASYYANYIVFDSPAPLGAADGPHQIFMRYLGGI